MLLDRTVNIDQMFTVLAGSVGTNGRVTSRAASIHSPTNPHLNIKPMLPRDVTCSSNVNKNNTTWSYDINPNSIYKLNCLVTSG